MLKKAVDMDDGHGGMRLANFHIDTSGTMDYEGKRIHFPRKVMLWSIHFMNCCRI